MVTESLAPIPHNIRPMIRVSPNCAGTPTGADDVEKAPGLVAMMVYAKGM
jgi:hypothetical protein